MSEAVATWHEANARHLSASLAWLRLRLEHQSTREGSVGLDPTLAAAAPSLARRSCFTRLLGRRRPRRAATTPVPLLPSPDPIADRDVSAAAQAVVRTEAAIDPPPALTLLSRRLGLTVFERHVLLLCAAVELDTRIEALCARAQGDATRTYPTFALALVLFEEPIWDALSPTRPLLYWRLVEIGRSGTPLTTSPLRADERVVNYLKGVNHLDERIAPLVTPLDGTGVAAVPSQAAIVSTIVKRLEGLGGDAVLPVVQLVGRDGPSRRLVARALGERLRLAVYVLAAELLPAQPAEMDVLVRLWDREAILSPVLLYVEPADGDPSPVSQVLRRFFARGRHLCLVGTGEVLHDLGRTTIVVDVEKPTASEQESLWHESLGDRAGDSPAALAAQFRLDGAQVREIAAEVLAQGSADVGSELWRACALRSRPRLEQLAQRIVPRACWDDLILPQTERDTLRTIAAQVGCRTAVYEQWGFARRMSRGLGVAVLFAGDSGTGKTLAAEVIASELALDLYRVDLAAVVSKYIGETEKNLRRLFDAAEDGGAILFFDEADALFGKRSEVRDSHDRYANIEINYLLQRMEVYRGLAILATNMQSALDTAFLRRLRFVVNFPFPGTDERRAIWARAFPPETPTAGLDLDRLASLHLAGGSIRNVALNAAFLAAHAKTAVTMACVFDAARLEFRKLNRPINESELR